MTSKSRYGEFNRTHQQEFEIENDAEFEDDENELDEDQEALIYEIEAAYDGIFKRNFIIKTLDKFGWDTDAVGEHLDEKYAIIISKNEEKQQIENASKQEQSKPKQGQSGDAEEPSAVAAESTEVVRKNSQQENELGSPSIVKTPGLCKKSSSESEENRPHQRMRKESLEVIYAVRSEDFKLTREVESFNQTYPPVKYNHAETGGNNMNFFNLVVVGNVDAGKSTLIAREAKQESFKYAYQEDTLKVERDRCITVDVEYRLVHTKTKTITILDSPGHKDFIPRMISGANQAEYAIILADAVEGAFEAGFDLGGETKEHAFLTKALGVQFIIVVVNKMDAVNWSQKRYEYIEEEMLNYLMSIGFEHTHIKFVPVSAFNGVNLSQSPNDQRAKWWKGPSLLELIEELPLPNRDDEKPVRFTIDNAYSKQEVKGMALEGKVEGGYIDKRDNFVVMPHGFVVGIKDLEVDGAKVPYVKVGQNAELLVVFDERDEARIRTGDVVCSLEYPIPTSKKIIIDFRAFIFKNPLLKGEKVEAFIQCAKTEAKVFKIRKLIDKHTGAIIKNNTKLLSSEECAEIELHLDNLVCVELYCNFRSYGRVILRQQGWTLGVGTIIEIL